LIDISHSTTLGVPNPDKMQTLIDVDNQRREEELRQAGYTIIEEAYSPSSRKVKGRQLIPGKFGAVASTVEDTQVITWSMVLTWSLASLPSPPLRAHAGPRASASTSIAAVVHRACCRDKRCEHVCSKVTSTCLMKGGIWLHSNIPEMMTLSRWACNVDVISICLFQGSSKMEV
jgi:hypothetical protein